MHTQTFRDDIESLIREFPEKSFIVDSRHFSESYPDAYLKINDQETMRLCGMVRAPEAPVVREPALWAAAGLFARFRKPVFVTRGSGGIIVMDDRDPCEIPGIRVSGRVDTVGAGDSALAGIGLALAAGRCRRDSHQCPNMKNLGDIGDCPSPRPRNGMGLVEQQAIFHGRKP